MISLETYQNIPQIINPIAFSIGFFSVRWYALMYLLAFLTVYLLLLWRIKKSEAGKMIDKNKLENLLAYSIVGLLLGARLGFVFLYNWSYFSHHLLEIFIPFDFSSHRMIGIYGMSYHGGLAGVIIATIIFCQKNKIDFWKWADFVVPAIPAGFFFGRIGNFINSELYGRVTEKWWGMHFENLFFLRHPSQIYEALGEGFLIFLILWPLRNKKYFAGFFLFFYLFLYGTTRFFIEFFRQPDSQIGFIKIFTFGQILSLLMILFAIVIFIWKKKKICYTGKTSD
jgi:phosphatidylglycerol:prolipoprotein diacylglycerol transferase